MPTKRQEDEIIEIIDGKKYLRLYYFMPAEHFLDVIEKDELKVSIPEKCNDPLEFMPQKRSLHDNQARYDGGFISFSRRYDSSIMWSHYADSHKGVCLEFLFPVWRLDDLGKKYNEESRMTRYAILDIGEKFKKQFMNIEGPNRREDYAIAFEVVCSENRPEGGIVMSGLYFDDCLDEVNISQAFYTKSKDWEYEKEWRLMVNLVQCESYKNDQFFIKGLTGYLERIILGVRFPEDQNVVRGRLQQVIKNNPLFWDSEGKRIKYPQVRRATYADNTYQIEVMI